MTKDAEKMLCCLYGIFKENNKTKNRSVAKMIEEDEISEKYPNIFDIDDISDLLEELRKCKYIKYDVNGLIELQDKGISYMEDLPKKELSELFDFITKLIP